MPNGTKRIDAGLDVIENLMGLKGRDMVELKMRALPNAHVNDALHIGGFRGGLSLFKSDGETHKRALVRAVTLAQLAFGKMQPLQASTVIDYYMKKSATELERMLREAFPFKAHQGDFARRADWAPELFTTPALHSEDRFRYIVHSIMGAASTMIDWYSNDKDKAERVEHYQNAQQLLQKNLAYGKLQARTLAKGDNPLVKYNLQVEFFREYLDNPNIVRRNIISSSVISEAKRATYYPFGFIMRVPAECVYITHHADVAVKNRTSNINFEFQDKHKGALRSPSDILAATTGVNSDLGYNEIVVVGSAPTGHQVTVNGIFVKTDAKGNLYRRPNNAAHSADAAPYVTPALVELIAAAARKHNLPIVPIVDTSSEPSHTPWPFGDLDRLTEFARPPSPTVTRGRRNSI